MNVLYTCDNNYVWLMGISVISLFENNKEISELDVYLLGVNISENNKAILEQIGAKYNRSIFVIEVSNLDIPESLTSTRWPLSAYTRLFAGDMLPKHIRRILYLDCDTIITSYIGELESKSFNNNIILGVKDCISIKYKQNIGLSEKDIYLNAGVLLMNIDEMRKMPIKDIIDSFINKYIKYINYADQDVLNGILKGKLGDLEKKYDVMSLDVEYSYDEIKKLRKPNNFYEREEFEEGVHNVAIIHYTTNMRTIRPWYNNSNHPLAKDFINYLHKSPWRDKKLDEMTFSSKESKIIKWIGIFPNGIAYTILGILHAELKPLYIRFKAKIGGEK